MPDLTEARPRKLPQQIRSQRRVDRILRAAIEVFEEVGFEAATTNAIAERADISVGSLYQYFPNKLALLQSLNDRCMEQSREVLDQVLTPDLALLELEVLIDRVLDALKTLYSITPRVLVSGYRPPEAKATLSSFEGYLVERVQTLIMIKAPHLEAPRRKLVAQVCVRFCDSLFELAVTSSKPQQEAILSETRALLLAYLAPMLTEKPVVRKAR